MDTFHLTEEQLKALIAEVYSRGIEDGNNANTNSVLKWAEEEACSLTQKNTDPIFDNARKMGDGLFHILGPVNCLTAMIQDGSIPNVVRGTKHQMSVLDFLNEADKGIRQVTEYRNSIMKTLYPNCMT